VDTELRPALLGLVEPDVWGDPESPLRWTIKSNRTLAEELTRSGHWVSADTVADLLRAEGFSLQGNAKTLEGKQNPDRDARFRYLNEQVKAHRAAGDAVVSVDTKKKELVGNYHNGGQEWHRPGAPVLVNTHDFPDKELGKAIRTGSTTTLTAPASHAAGHKTWCTAGRSILAPVRGSPLLRCPACRPRSRPWPCSGPAVHRFDSRDRTARPPGQVRQVIRRGLLGLGQVAA
jgi:hypothetical protein